MIIEITSSGGFGGLGMPQMTKRVDLASRAKAETAALCEAFDPAHLAALESAAKPEGAADMFTYHITVTEPGEAPRRFDIREDQLPAEMLDLIDAM